MLKSLWHRLASSRPTPADERALARYFRDEGLHAELASFVASDARALSGHERILYAAHSYFAA
jgi:hypothetical protein